MKKVILFLFFALSALVVFAQQSEQRPLRTPEEEARKQTAILEKELTLTPLQRDTVYRIHLKYALLRQQPHTRAEAFTRMNTMVSELLGVLTQQQRDQFLNKQIDPEPRRQMPRLPRMQTDTIALRQ